MAMKTPVLVDTNAILALLDHKDPKHLAARAVLPIRMLLPSIILPEVDYLATTRLGGSSFSKRLGSW
jgi:predicted nucleic acid-binding protein